MTYDLDEVLDKYDASSAASYFNIGVVNKAQAQPVVQKDAQVEQDIVEPKEEKESMLDTAGRAALVGTTKMMEETPKNLARAIALPVEIATAGLNKIGFDIKNPVMGEQFLLDGIQKIKDIGAELIPTSLNEKYNAYLSKPYDNEITGVLAETLAQFGSAAVPAASFVKLVTNANPFTRSLMWGAIADYIAFNPNDPTAIQTLFRNPEDVKEADRESLREMLLGLVTKYEDDPQIVKQSKSVIEGLTIGGLLEKTLAVGKIIPWSKVVGGGTVAGAAATTPNEAEGGLISKLINRLSRAETTKLKV